MTLADMFALDKRKAELAEDAVAHEMEADDHEENGEHHLRRADLRKALAYWTQAVGTQGISWDLRVGQRAR